MATVKVLRNILKDKVDTFTAEAGTTIESLVRAHTDGNSYDGVLVECYDLDTGETYFAPIEDDPAATSVAVQVNGKDADLCYEIAENDVVFIAVMPSGGGWDWGSAFIMGITGAVSGALLGSSASPYGIIIGAIVGFAVGFVLGGLSGVLASGDIDSDVSSSSGLNSENLPDVRGSQNQPLTDQTYPMVLGKHLTVPFIIGSPWNEISGRHGEENCIHALYAVGYAPLRLTDFKLGEMFLAHNQPWSGNEGLRNIFHGALHGTDDNSGSGEDSGEIVNTWKSNDITLEILQQPQDGGAVDYGNVYPYARIQEEIKANVLYIADGSLSEIDRGNNISYKGCGLANGLRNNPVRFSEQFPHSLTVELDFANGLYKTRSETSDDKSSVKYYRIPLWVAVQWRVYSEQNDKSDGEGAGKRYGIPKYDYENRCYKTFDGMVKRDWNSFEVINNTIAAGTYTKENRYNDLLEHTGNRLRNELTQTETGGGAYEPVVVVKYYDADINGGWIGEKAFNIEPLGGTNDAQDGINEFRCVTEVNLVEWARKNLRSADDTDAQFADKFRSYFYDGTNTTKSIEVRVVRVSPCYIDETVTTKEHSAFKFNDVFTWTTLTSTVLDGDRLMQDGIIEQKRPMSEERMRRLCVVALKAKTDNTDQLSNTLKKFSCVAQSFAPYYDDERKSWMPERVSTVTRYYKPYDAGTGEGGAEIGEHDFLADRQAGIRSLRMPGGNDFVRQIVNGVIRTPAHYDGRGRYFLPDDDGTLRYCGNNVASMFLLAGIGAHLGNDALGYVQRDFAANGHGDFNMASLAEWYKWAEDVTDGSTYSSDGFHYVHDGERVSHRKGEPVSMYFTANAYIYKEEMLENMLAKIAVAGRSVYTRDRMNRITVVTDKPEKYPVALISQQNTLKSTHTISFAEPPSGLQITFPDENDGYVQNQIYCMADGESAGSPRGALEQYKFDYVTNSYQIWSLGRYLLANRVLNREGVSKQVGIEGASISLGDVVLIQDDTMLIGTDTGGRITELIETERTIYGFLTDNTYRYTGETEEHDGSARCRQGVIVMQPSQYKESRVITLRLARDGTEYTVNGITYRAEKGTTNVVLLDVPVAKDRNASDGSEYYVFRPNPGNIVGFGIIGQMTAAYRVMKIKQDSKRNYDLTLMKYQDDMYEYGAALPSFQNNMTVPDRSGEDSFSLSNSVTMDDLVKALADSGEIAQGKIDGTFGKTPDVPGNVFASVRQDCVQLACSVDSDEVSNIDHISYEITKADGSVSVIDGSYSTEYFFDRNTDGYPEKETLALWRFRAKSVSIYVDENGNRVESGWSEPVPPTASSLAEYGTWIPPKPVSVRFVAEQEGITASWECDLSRVYGNVQYDVSVFYEKRLITVSENGADTVVSRQSVTTRWATYQFNRKADGFPEKPGTEGMRFGTRTLDNYSVIVRAANITSGKSTDSGSLADGTDTSCDWSRYRTWIPSVPEISSRVSNRNVTLYLSQSADCYGEIRYLVGVRRYNDKPGVFYVPDLETNPYSRETAYKMQKDGVFIVGSIESESQFSQTMPLETQNGTQGMLAVSKDDSRVIAVPVSAPGDDRILYVPLGGFAPVDTSYQFEAYAFNKAAEDFYDSLTGADHGYDKDTYHKVSVSGARRNAVALATSVQDVLNGSIVSDKVGTGAITETKIEDDAISTPKLQANAVVADKIYTYNLLTLHNGAHAISGYAYNEDLDEDVRELISMIKAGREINQNGKPNIELLDDIIRRKSTNYWIGLDTDHPEFYMGNCVVGEKLSEAANYFHYYFKDGDTNLDIKLSNFIVTALSSTIKGYFSVRNKNGSVKYTGANSFIQMNPETSASAGETKSGYYHDGAFYEDAAHSVFIVPEMSVTYEDVTKGADGRPLGHLYQWYGSSYSRVSATNAETMVLKGDMVVDRKNSDGSGGRLSVRGWTTLTGGLSAGNDDGSFAGLIARVFGSLGVSGDITGNGGMSLSGHGKFGSVAVLGLLQTKTLSVTSDASLNGDVGIAAGKKLVTERPSAGYWVKGRDNAAIRQRYANVLWAPLMSLKTRSGSVEIGTSSENDNLYILFSKDSDYNALNNTVTHLMTFSADGNVSVNGSMYAGGKKLMPEENALSAQAAFDAAHPVGEPYTQYPGIPDPQTLYNKNGITSTWQVVDYGGAFFRAEGGMALDFNGGLQSESLPKLRGEFTVDSNADEIGGAFRRGGETSRESVAGASGDGRHVYLEPERYNAVWGRREEVAPKNYTIKVWKRTS